MRKGNICRTTKYQENAGSKEGREGKKEYYVKAKGEITEGRKKGEKISIEGRRE